LNPFFLYLSFRTSLFSSLKITFLLSLHHWNQQTHFLLRSCSSRSSVCWIQDLMAKLIVSRQRIPRHLLSAYNPIPFLIDYRFPFLILDFISFRKGKGWTVRNSFILIFLYPVVPY
jgi:hypothetical protein